MLPTNKQTSIQEIQPKIWDNANPNSPFADMDTTSSQPVLKRDQVNICYADFLFMY